MKILTLRFKNLNSLYGEWEIDFTRAEYTSNGIFALTGATGAGKSTILDAICLALYGETPRLGKITQSSNEIMSKQTGECYAEVLFESQKGRFLCHWSQQKARKNPQGNLQDQKHEISNAGGAIIETKKSRTIKIVEEKTGMDFDRFTRSILLAQGGFDTFLKANIEDKSKILEQITGTEIYTKISQKVHERYRESNQTLDLLLAEIAGITLLSAEEISAIKEKISLEEKEKQRLSEQVQQSQQAIQWINTMKKLENDLHQLKQEKEMLAQDEQNFQKDRDRLERADRSIKINDSYLSVQQLRKQQSEDKQALLENEEQFPIIDTDYQHQSQSLTAAEKKLAALQTAYKNAQPQLKEVRLLDSDIHYQNQQIKEKKQACEKIQSAIESGRKEQKSRAQNLKELQEKAQRTAAYLASHSADEALTHDFSAIAQRLQSLKKAKESIKQQHTKLDSAIKALNLSDKKSADSLSKYQKQKLAHQQARQNVEGAQQGFTQLLNGKLLREYYTEKDQLQKEKAYISKIIALEDYRAQLEDGRACPLCGAKHHPFAEGNVPQPDAVDKKIQQLTDLIQSAENQKAQIEISEKAANTAQTQLNALQLQTKEADYSRQTAEKTVQDLHDAIAAAENELQRSEADILKQLQAFSIDNIDDVDFVLSALRQHLNDWQQCQQQQQQLESQTAEAQLMIKQLAQSQENQETDLKERKAQLQQQQEAQRKATDKRRARYGDKDPDVEETKFQQQIEQATQTEKGLRENLQAAHEKLTAIKTKIETLNQRTAKRERSLIAEEKAFANALQSVNFADETDFLSARLIDSELAVLKIQDEALKNRKIEINSTEKERQKRLSEEQAKQLSEKNRDELQAIFDDKKEQLDASQKLIITEQQKLVNDGAAKAKIKNKQSDIDKQKKEHHRWQKLYDLIGSADGKKFRNFAQGLTFEIMVAQANQQLQKMTDRYVLIRDKEEPLSLNVIDHYQASEERSIKNLSGGESFIVSLTLALGLSKMSSRKVRVDSLFLDEGFGTLDEEALETALATLSGLQQDGKLIGIISHVAELKERISTQINVSKRIGGRSLLKGPGVSELSRH